MKQRVSDLLLHPLPLEANQGFQLYDGWKREALSGTSEMFKRAMEQAETALTEGGDPQQADLILDRACYSEMAQLAKELRSPFLEGYVRLCVDTANLRAAVRVHRMGREGEFLRQVLLPGGNVSEGAIAAARGDALGEVFRSGPLAQAADLGARARLNISLVPLSASRFHPSYSWAGS